MRVHLEIRDTKASFWFDKSELNEIDVRVTAHGPPGAAVEFGEHVLIGSLDHKLVQQLDRIESKQDKIMQQTARKSRTQSTQKERVSVSQELHNVIALSRVGLKVIYDDKTVRKLVLRNQQVLEAIIRFCEQSGKPLPLVDV